MTLHGLNDHHFLYGLLLGMGPKQEPPKLAMATAASNSGFSQLDHPRWRNVEFIALGGTHDVVDVYRVLRQSLRF